MTEQSKPAYEQLSKRRPLTAGRSESRTRSHLVGVRLTPDEHADLTRLAASMGCSLPDVLRAGLHLFTATETTDV